MSKQVFELPELIDFNDYQNYDLYEEALLEVYERDLWKGSMKFNGLNVIPRVHKRFELSGKMLDWTFAHFTSKGKIEEDREFDLRRCERIGWVKPIIDNAHLDCVKVWENDRHHNGKTITSVILWCEFARTKVVITKLKRKIDYYVITTFYLINKHHKIKSLNDEYNAYVKINGEYKVNIPSKNSRG